MRLFLVLAACCGAVCAQQTEIRRQPDPDQQRRQQEQDERRRNEEARDPYRGWQGISRASRIQGKVVMPDGAPPPASVAVDMLCGESLRRAWTDSRGLFSFALSTPTPDASTRPVQQPSGAEAPAGGCLLSAHLPGFRAAPVEAGGLRGDFAKQYVITLRSVEGVSGFTFSATSLTAPGPAVKSFEKGRELLRKKKLAEAETAFRRAIAKHPNYAAAWYELGRALAAQGRTGEARDAFELAVMADPKYLSPYPQLAQLALAEKRWDDLAAATGAVIRLNPFFSANTYFFSALANLNLNRLPLAEKHAREAIRMDEAGQLPQARQILGRVLARTCRGAEAAEQLRIYLERAPAAADAQAVRELLSQVESPAFAQGCAASNSQPNSPDPRSGASLRARPPGSLSTGMPGALPVRSHSAKSAPPPRRM